ncbi:alpha/beta fold hydrolase [Microbispora sp. H11081]|uniref:alpha/beta fold hydrolase n=1 Tax=Microbispora sp. H11081 TaxID=2729107 RepID=UPI002015E57E|nr:alpha/beta hydrolase [Microbispora sp. H11081]
MSMPVVFVHGIRMSGTMWSPVRELLRAPSAAPDLPGHGHRRGEPYDTEAACRVVAEAIEELGGRALVVGMSLGGYVGIATAARHPGLVAGLVAMGCTARPDRPIARAYRLMGHLASRDPERADRMSRFALRRMLPGAVGEAAVAGGLSSEVVTPVVTAVTAEDPLADLAGYQGRVWLVNGRRDPFRADEQAFLRACANGSLTHVPRRGHLTVLADPAWIARFVDDAAETVTACRA